jgi:hypothetical protein
MTVWDSIALHTTPEVPRYKQPRCGSGDPGGVLGLSAARHHHTARGP